MRYLGGHLGITVSALLDGQLDPGSAERAWAHVQGCGSCRAQVEREGWVKTRLARMASEEAPPPQLLGSLYGLGSHPGGQAGPGSGHDPEAWAAVREIERRGRSRRRAGLAVAGAGGVSAAVLGLASLTGATLGIGSAPAGSPTAGLTRSPSTTMPALVAPVARVHGRLPIADPQRAGAPGRPGPRGEESGAGLSR